MVPAPGSHRHRAAPAPAPGKRPYRWLPVLVIAAVALSVLPLPAPAVEAAPPEVVVSLTWDDGRANQLGSLDIQDRYGFDATYYVNSAMIGDSSYYLTKPNLDRIAASGAEIGGHTERHTNLTSASTSTARTAICNDRQRLVDWYGPNAGRSFAYPYGAVNEQVEGIVQSCGYDSARGVGGVRQVGSCGSCPLTETVPPADPYRLRSLNSVLDPTTLADLKQSVTQAEQAGGGWVVYVLHDLGTGGDGYGIDPTVYDQFLSWLASKSNIRVETVADALAGPAAPGGLDTGNNLLVNPGLEIDANNDGLADCWQRTGYGVNQYQFSRTSEAHSGSFAEQVTVTGFTSGDRKILPFQDSGTCAPAVTGGEAYRMGVWYESTVPVNIVVFYRDGGGTWRYWRTGPAMPAANQWTWATFSPGPLPSDARAVSFGVALTAVGTLRTDDYVLVPAVAPPTDTTPPTVALTQPADGAPIAGTTQLAAEATDNIHVTAVEFRVRGTVVGTDTSAPFALDWDSTTVADGAAPVTAVARDAHGNATTSEARTVQVANGAAPATLRNPSLESRDADRTPSCWTRTGYGTNTFLWSETGDTHSGPSAEQLMLTSRVTGDRKLLIKMDAGQAAGGCAPNVTPGRTYDLSTWYQSTVPTGIVVYYRTATGEWVYWKSSWIMPASSTWVQARYTTPPLPADATALSFGMYLATPGTLKTDDYGMGVRS